MNNHIYQGHWARKRFGQNFLHDSYIIEYIVAAIHPQFGQAMVEIGSGLGALTKPIAARVNRMTVIELDRNLAARLATHPFLQSKLKIIQQDAMTVDFSALSAEHGQTLRVFGNLPYNISTRLIFHILSYTHAIHDMHFMLQKEVVDRLVAGPGNKAYGRLSVMTQYHCQVFPVLEVPPASFKPKPKVYSEAVRLVPYASRPFPVCDLSKLAIITSLAFSQRRKMILNSIGHLFSIEQMTELGIDTTLRAENISVEQYCRLANLMTNRSV